jgi:hypothetical protein
MTLKWLKSLTPNIYLIVTDLSLMPPQELMHRFKAIYTQSKKVETYGAIEQHECYGYKPMDYTHKYIPIYFGGTERGRTKDFFEYVYRPEVLWYGKSDSLEIKNYIPYHEHIDTMKHAKYSIVIGDESYNKVGFITPRYYECLRYDVLPFVDMKYDPYEMMVPMKSFTRVRNFSDMIAKIRTLDRNLELYQSLIREQRQEITNDMIKGHTIEKLLLKSR